MRALAVAIALALVATLPSAAAAKRKVGDGTGGVELRQLGEFESPVHIDNAPGSKRLLFVVEQGGTIRILRGNDTLGNPFLDIRDRVEARGEEGLLSVAFPPDYEQSGRFFVYYMVRGGDVNRVSEFRRSTATTADPGSERPVIQFSHPTFGNHNGGQLQFGPDGQLYVATGDGGGGGDPDGNGQNVNSLLGKLLRIDPLPGNAGAYGTPAGNPFAGPTPGLDEIYALGLRNPWPTVPSPTSFGEGAKGRIYVASLGGGVWKLK